MSLTGTDLREIRSIIHEELNLSVEPLWNEIKALRNDVKEIYGMIAQLESGLVTDKNFKKLTLERKLLRLNAELIAAAKQAGIILPRP